MAADTAFNMPDPVSSTLIRPVISTGLPATDAAPARPATPRPLETPLAPVSLPRSHAPSADRDRGISVNAVLLGLAAVPAAALAILSPTSAAHAAPRAQLPTDGTAAESVARSHLFAARASAEDPNVTELKTKIARLVTRNFQGDTRAAFNHYAGADGQINRDELTRILADAGIGNFITRGAWVSGVMERVDGNANNKISWAEFEAVIQNATGNA